MPPLTASTSAETTAASAFAISSARPSPGRRIGKRVAMPSSPRPWPVDTLPAIVPNRDDVSSNWSIRPKK
jgi:hypothetical protein